MAGNARSFNAVMDEANKILKKGLGYEIVELKSRAEREKLEESEQKKTGTVKSPPLLSSFMLINVFFRLCDFEDIYRSKHSGG